MKNASVEMKKGRLRKAERFLRIVAINLIVFIVLDYIIGLTLNDRLFPSNPKIERHESLGFRSAPGLQKHSRSPEHPDGGYLVQYNQQGLRADVEYNQTKRADTSRILIVGDSHTDGSVANSETYPAQLERLLRRSSKKPVEVINGGTARYSPYQCYLRLEQQLVRLDPDVLIVAVYVGNDLLDLLRFDDRPSLAIAEDGSVFARPPEFLVYADPPLRLWLGRSFAYRLYERELKYGFDRVRLVMGLVDSLGGDMTDMVDFSSRFKSCNDRALISQSLAQAAYFDRFEAARERSFQLLQHVLELHKQLAERQGFSLHALIVPTRLQVEPDIESDRVAGALKAMKLPPTAISLDDSIHDQLLQLLAAESIPVIDPRDSFRAASSSDAPLYWSHDLHINVRGCRIMAEAIQRYLGTLGSLAKR